MKRKLSDLKENECIKVNTLKEAKYFIKKLRWNKELTPKELVGNYLANEGNDNIVWIDFVLSCELPASDFIKQKKSKLKKVWQEIARLDKEVHDLKNADKTKPDLFLGLECEPKELTELPEKWCVEHSESALLWIRENSEVCGHNISRRRYYMFPCNSGGNNSSDKTPEGYTLISQSDFERLVLNKPKEITQEKEIDFRNGKLFEYKSMSEGLIVMIDLENSKNKTTVLATCVQNNSNHTWCRLGESRYWEKSTLTPFESSITLKNE